MPQPIKGFSKLSKEQKIDWLIKTYFDGNLSKADFLKSYWHTNEDAQQLHDEFIENTLTNYYLPFGIAPNFQINGKMYALPMAIEESSVVAAASKSASFWLSRGGFKAEVISTIKIGHVHFIWEGEDFRKLETFIDGLQTRFLAATDHITANMRQRGGGILSIRLVDKTDDEPNYYQLEARFETCDSMGANFINSCLEAFASVLREESLNHPDFISTNEKHLDVVMCILSNFTPECLVRAEVRCSITDLQDGNTSGEEFARKFQRAINIANAEPYRATTHNKGIMNGIDAVVIATGNDFRAIEACAHSYAAHTGKYRSLTHCEVLDGEFCFYIELPLSLGVVGGLTSLHPMVKFSLELLGKPSASELMMIIAASGLAQNFAALRALVTTGIQKGHMKMHLLNILNQLGATEDEREIVKKYFEDKVVVHADVIRYFCALRGISEEAALAHGK